MKSKIIIIFIIVLLLVAFGSYLFGLRQGVEKAKTAYEEMMSEISFPTVNPMENLPSANPFGEVKINPFEGIRINPFK